MSHIGTRHLPMAINPPGLALFALLCLAALAVFWTGLRSLGLAWSTPEYSHGPLIPLISLYLFLRELRDTPRAVAPPGVGWGHGLLVLLLALGLAGLGTVAAIPDVVTYALILWLAGVVLLCFGWTEGRRHQLPVLHLVFMLPLPQVLYWQLTIVLQGLSSEVGVWIIRLMGIPVFLEGNVIDLGPYKLLVAEACSGLRYLFPILSFSYLIAILYRGPFWHRALLFLMAAPLTVVMNAFRIGMIGALVNWRGIGQAEGFMHVFEGWAVFGLCVALLLAAAGLLQRTTRRPASLSETIDLDFDGLGRQAARALGLPASRGLLAGTLATLAVALALAAAPPPAQRVPERAQFSAFPLQFAGWSGAAHALEPEIEAVLGATDYLNASYLAPEGGPPVAIFAAWYRSQTQGEGIHSPEVCLPAGGWEIETLGPLTLVMPQTVYGRFTVNRSVIRKGLQRQLVYYWFEQRGQRMTNDVRAKLTVLRDGLTRGRSDGGLVRFTTPIGPRESIDSADSRLQGFMQRALRSLPRFIPE
ncbi:VPLPA-CTERM-specific exosortase XrtD (plasmid) [Alloyangia pacifica]|uniref:VPLPA-CTERM-specific exosortase XrtD n=1 Tax=Alloyangia pacifica TaxID=311180 RepID=A0A2U8HM07_9RHOB|nr:VPLPA-CTERM-specific exosortase XrtD [Alloyangia pacifica]AWI86793.1 VPLPA-CTERM-specific exosortase XrtD [Alloyangia pacifica]